jgi:heme-degrading monooxygenase HmoA
MYIAIRKYYIIPGSGDEFMQRVQRGFVPVISQVPGFISYYALRVRNDEVVTISIFETRTGAEESTPRALEWVQKNIAWMIQGFPEVMVSQVRASSEPVGLAPTSYQEQLRGSF